MLDMQSNLAYIDNVSVNIIQIKKECCMSPKSLDQVSINTNSPGVMEQSGERPGGELRGLSDEQWSSLEKVQTLREQKEPGWFSFGVWSDRYDGTWEVAIHGGMLGRIEEEQIAKMEKGIAVPTRVNKENLLPQVSAWSVFYCPPSSDEFLPVKIVGANLPRDYMRLPGGQGNREFLGIVMPDGVVGDWLVNSALIITMHPGAQAGVQIFPDYMNSPLPLVERPTGVKEKVAKKMGGAGVGGYALATAA